jgi:hypothetical protein
MVETAVSVLPRMGRSRGKCADESKRYENDPSVIPPSLQQQQQWTPARVSGNDNVTTASAVSTLPSPVQLVEKSVQGGKSYESVKSDPDKQQQQQQSRRQRKNRQRHQQKYRQEKSMNQFGYGSNGRFRGKSSSSSMENGDCDDNQYHGSDDDDYNDNTTWMEGLMEEFLDSQEMNQGNERNGKARNEKGTTVKSKGANDSNSKTDGGNDKIFVQYCDDILLVLSHEILEAIRTIMLEREQQRRNERKSYTDVYAYQYRRAVKATRAATRNTKVGHIDGYYKIFEEANSDMSTEVSKSSESDREQPGATTQEQQQPPPLPPQVQQQRQTTAGQAAACSSKRRQQVRARKRNEKTKATDKAKNIQDENGTDWVSWKYGNGRHSGMNSLVQIPIWNSTRVWDTQRTEREGGGKAATVTRFR